MGRIERRRLLLAAGVLVLGPRSVRGQPKPGTFRVGFVSPTSPGPTFDAFRAGLKDSGYIEGRNVVVEARFAEGRADRLPSLVADVLRSGVDVLVVGSSNGALAAKGATTTVPIVFAGLIDPVTSGLVASLARPGGNITGATFGVGESSIAAKWVELLKEAVPGATSIAVLWNPDNPANARLVPEMRTATRKLNVRHEMVEARSPAALADALAAIAGGGARGMIVTNDPTYFANREQIVRFAAARRVPAIYFTRDFVDVGGLMSYGSSVADSYRRAAAYVDRILKGAQPADLPVEQPTKFGMVVNLNTARALGLAIPQAVLLRADEVIG